MSGGAPATVALVAPRLGVELANFQERKAIRRVTGVLEHAPEVDQHLRVDVLPVRSVEDLGLGSDVDDDLPVGLLRHRPDRLEERLNLSPLDVPVGGVLEELPDR